MGLSLREPSTVLVVDPTSALSGLAERLTEQARERRDDGSADPWADTPDPAVETVESAAAARERLGATDVACLVVGAVEDPQALVTDALEHDPDLPVLYVPDSADPGAAAAVAAAGGRYLPGELDRERLVGVVFDALDRYRERWRRGEATSVLETMLSELEVAIYAKDTQARHVMMSDVPGGPAPEEAAGRTDAQLYDGVDTDETTTDDERVIETGEPVYRKVESHGEAPAQHWSRTTKVPWVEGDEIRGLVGISVDITDLKFTELELEEQNERLERFADYVSHDLKNPLQVAMGYVGVARGGDHDAELAKAEDALDRMDEMLDDLRHTVQSGGVPGNEGSESPLVRLDDLVEGVWATLDTGEATLELGFEEPVTLVAADADVRPLVENLLKNALHHAGPDVTVHVGSLPDGFYVEDDGPGIPEDDRERVFEEGYTTAESGTGTGLSLVARTADEHRWDLSLGESDAGGVPGERRDSGPRETASPGARFEFRNAAVAGGPPAVEATGEALDLDETADVGEVTVGDRSSYDGSRDRWTVECDGADIWRDVNEFHYVFARVPGDARIEGRLVEFEGASQYSKAGVMVRDDTGEDSAYGYVGGTGDHGTELLWRSRAGADGRSQQLDEDDLCEYFRADRIGDEVACSVSDDGVTWRTVDRRPVALSDPVCLGVAVCSNVPREPATAVFEGVTVTDLARED